MVKKARYQIIADEIHCMIDNKVFGRGAPIYSRQSLCDHYGISNVTANRVQDELRQRGVATTVKGKGLFVSKHLKTPNPNSKTSKPLKRLYVHRRKGNAKYSGIYDQTIYEGVIARAEELGLEIVFEKTEMNGSSMFSKALQFSLNPDEGFVLVGCYKVQAAYGHILTDPNIHTAVIETIVAGSINVLTDNYHGMKELMNHAVSKGCKRLILAGRFSGSQNPINENERIEAFINLSEEVNAECICVDSGKQTELFELLKSGKKKTAVMFTQDDPALIFRKVLAEKLPEIKVLITGFDDLALREQGLETLTTYRVNFHGLGASAVDALKEHKPSWRIERYQRVRGELVVRQ